MKPERQMQVIVLWEQLLHELLDVGNNFPKSVRPVVTNRMLNYAFDVLDTLVMAQYSERMLQEPHLIEAQLFINKVRVLLRIACVEKWLSEGRLIALSEKIDAVSKGVYGWQESLSTV